MQRWLSIGFLVIVAGCKLVPSPTLQRASLPSHEVIYTDAKTRAMTTSAQSIFSSTGISDPQAILCIEPSPDVATAIVNSFGAGAGLFGRGAASISGGQAEGIAQLGERTVAIQVLAQKMSQLCNAYANGSISGTTYSLQMSRIDDSIVTLALGDGAAGAFGRKLAGIGGDSTETAAANVSGPLDALANIEDQAAKLSASNKKVDDAATALKNHNASSPTAGKEEEYKATKVTLETALTQAKAERDATLQMMQSASTSRATTSAKISKLETGGALSPNPSVEVLRDMQAQFLVGDIGRDVTHVCLIELGLRGETETKQEMTRMASLFEELFKASPNATSGSNYAGAVLRNRTTSLTALCNKLLPTLVASSVQQLHDYRMRRTQLNFDAALANYSAANATASAQNKKFLMDSISLCRSEFKDDVARQNACLDQFIPIKLSVPDQGKGAEAKSTGTPGVPSKKHTK